MRRLAPNLISLSIGGIVVAALCLAAMIWWAPGFGLRADQAASGGVPAVATKAAIPQVEPTRFRPLPASDAQAINARSPILSERVPPALPFQQSGGSSGAARARDCLAAAVFYEAGDDAEGQRAVAQVVLNRARHPAFPKSVCGVVFQGSERRTGCQFTFTCDGSMSRRAPSAAAWRRARDVASAAMSGSVYTPVGLATHYHTDWVVPYWSAKLDKIAKVGTHLFFRWTGWWGSPRAFRQVANAGEPEIGRLDGLSDAPTGAIVQARDGTVAAIGGRPRGSAASADDPDLFLVKLPPGGSASHLSLAKALCGDRASCRVIGWSNAQLVARSLPLTPSQLDAVGFRYTRDRRAGIDEARWDCARAARADRSECLRPGLIARAPEDSKTVDS